MEAVPLKQFMRRHLPEIALRKAFRAVASEPSKNRLRLVGDGYQVRLRQPHLQRYDDGDFFVRNDVNAGVMVDHLRLKFEDGGVHTWAPGHYGLSVAGESGVPGQRSGGNLKAWTFRDLEIDVSGLPITAFHASAAADMRLDHYVGKNFSHPDSVAWCFTKYIRPFGFGWAPGAGFGSGHGFQVLNPDITGGGPNPGWAGRVEAGDVDYTNLRLSGINGIWQLGGFKCYGPSHLALGRQDGFFKRPAFYLPRHTGTVDIQGGEIDNGYIMVDSLADPLGEGTGAEPVNEFSHFYLADVDFSPTDSVPPLVDGKPVGLVTFNARPRSDGKLAVLRHFQIEPRQAGVTGYDDPAHLPVHIAKFLSDGRHDHSLWDPKSEQAGRLNMPSGPNVVSGLFPGRMRHQLARFHDASGVLHNIQYEPNHPLGPGLVITAPGTTRAGYIGMSADILRFGTAATGSDATASLEITGAGVHRPSADGTLDDGSQSRRWKDYYLSGIINQGGIQIITGAGSPEGSITAPVGSVYRRTNGGLSTTLYFKYSGTGNTGWVAARGYLQATVVWDPASIASGAQSALQTITVTGATLGMEAQVFASVDLQGLMPVAYVSAADTVKFFLANMTGGAVDLGSATFTVRVS